MARPARRDVAAWRRWSKIHKRVSIRPSAHRSPGSDPRLASGYIGELFAFLTVYQALCALEAEARPRAARHRIKKAPGQPIITTPAAQTKRAGQRHDRVPGGTAERLSNTRQYCRHGRALAWKAPDRCPAHSLTAQIALVESSAYLEPFRCATFMFEKKVSRSRLCFDGAGGWSGHGAGKGSLMNRKAVTIVVIIVAVIFARAARYLRCQPHLWV
jgi:hypothetical protein